MSEPELVDETEPEVPSSPGEILAAERKQLRLSQQDVADQLNLRLDVINSIESNNYDEIPAGETFVRGYIRAYARLVDIDEDDVLEERSYEVESGSVSRPVFAPNLNKERAPRPRRIRKTSGAPKFILGFGVLAVVIIATWSFSDIPSLNIGQWISSFSDSDTETAVQAGDAVTGDLPVQVNVTRLDTAEFDQQQSTQDELSVKSSTSDSDIDSVTTVVVTENNSEPKVATAIQIDESVNPVNTTEEVEEAQSENITESSSEEVISLTQEESIAIQTTSTDPVTDEETDVQNTLMLVSEDASWAEVRDATGQRLLYAMLQPRQTRNLSGQAPFDITLGNASSVKIRLDDSAMEISDHIRPGRTAHLRIGKDGVSKTP